LAATLVGSFVVRLLPHFSWKQQATMNSPPLLSPSPSFSSIDGFLANNNDKFDLRKVFDLDELHALPETPVPLLSAPQPALGTGPTPVVTPQSFNFDSFMQAAMVTYFAQHGNAAAITPSPTSAFPSTSTPPSAGLLDDANNNTKKRRIQQGDDGQGETIVTDNTSAAASLPSVAAVVSGIGNTGKIGHNADNLILCHSLRN
jgi:hypothetical protein